MACVESEKRDKNILGNSQTRHFIKNISIYFKTYCFPIVVVCDIEDKNTCTDYCTLYCHIIVQNGTVDIHRAIRSSKSELN